VSIEVAQPGGLDARTPPSPVIAATAPSVTTISSRRCETRWAFFLEALLSKRPVSKPSRDVLCSFGNLFSVNVSSSSDPDLFTLWVYCAAIFLHRLSASRVSDIWL
jgi:hypothetical protein